MGIRDGNGAAVLHVAARPRWGQDVEVAQLLLQAGTDRLARNENGVTPANLAAAASHSETALLLGHA